MNSIVARKRILLFSETEELALCCLPLPEQGQWSYICACVCVDMCLYVDHKTSSFTLNFSAFCPSNTANSAHKGLQGGWICISLLPVLDTSTTISPKLKFWH